MGTRRIRHGCGGRHRGHCAVPLPPPLDNRKAAIKLALHAAPDLFAAAGHSARKDGPDIDRRGPAARHSGEPFRFRRLENGARPMHAPLRARIPDSRQGSCQHRFATHLPSFRGSARPQAPRSRPACRARQVRHRPHRKAPRRHRGWQGQPSFRRRCLGGRARRRDSLPTLSDRSRRSATSNGRAADAGRSAGDEDAFAVQPCLLITGLGRFIHRA